ncbi:hypothetical protein M408DRAFT_330192 [Serendipita vermifera MAFF 305830]|uniref:Uncharacterized protein n=1 Tax=Serendipita vermifera MAFF 305830 TaxID=933852 RepID=A0A0C2XD71_SERVB|nr:hypothetical protein M408DRAFT_330192 [Serendipita vermifera MAFF 305830]
MLPTHNKATATGEHPTSSIKHYSIKSSDVIDQRSRITVEDGSGMLWYKTRELTEHEIVDSLTDAKTNQTRWTIHQPSQKGWYLRLRSPLFPPGACIALTPPQSPPQPTAGHEHTGSGTGNPSVTGPVLAFGCQTLVPMANARFGGGSSASARSSVDHSYPPSRSSMSSQTQAQPEPTAAPASVDPEVGSDITQVVEEPTSGAPASKITPSRSQPPRKVIPPPAPRWQVTHYTLQTGIPISGPLAGTHHHPHLVNQPTHAPQPSLFHRALAPLSNLALGATGGGGAHHFTIQPVVPVVGGISPSGSHSLSTTTSPDPSFGLVTTSLDSAPSPFLAFTDSTPLLRATPSGTISVDESRVKELGVEMAFWVTVALAFWEFLREREGYLAASQD